MKFNTFIKTYGLYIIFFQSLIAMLGSLYYGFYGDPIANILAGQLFPYASGYSPCELCRYARILMYPIVWLSLIAIIKKDTNIVNYILPISIVGILLEIYHYMLQKVNIGTSFFCTKANPCDALQVNYLDFITIPFLCLIAFVVIFTVSVLILRANRNGNSQ